MVETPLGHSTMMNGGDDRCMMRDWSWWTDVIDAIIWYIRCTGYGLMCHVSIHVSFFREQLPSKWTFPSNQTSHPSSHGSFHPSPCYHITGRRISQGLLQQTYDAERADVLWADYEDLDWDRILEGHVKANAYLVRKGLSRKAQLGYHLRKYLSKRPDCCLREAFPETLVIETWEAFESKMTFGVLEGARSVSR